MNPQSVGRVDDSIFYNVECHLTNKYVCHRKIK